VTVCFGRTSVSGHDHIHDNHIGRKVIYRNKFIASVAREDIDFPLAVVQNTQLQSAVALIGIRVALFLLGWRVAAEWDRSLAAQVAVTGIDAAAFALKGHQRFEALLGLEKAACRPPCSRHAQH
jgi:hypothetical protein